ncbi:hypothetical protein T09_2583 [Trichinella sp. T9]|nr:hypothetical protein T09_2583 [Trichinella sp. T9]KRZ91396.1 hypothetical protein T08_16026 [Trichinella sp. T8]
MDLKKIYIGVNLTDSTTKEYHGQKKADSASRRKQFRMGDFRSLT